MPLTGERKREYQREWVAARRAQWFADRTCRDCPATEDLELHHLDPDTKVSHRIWSWSWPRIEAETAKCAPLCRSCHTRTFVETAQRSIPWAVIVQIRERHAAGESGEVIAEDLGTGHGYTYRVINGEVRKDR